MHLAFGRTLVACALADDATVIAAVHALRAAGIADASVRVGAEDAARAQTLARTLGLVADVDVRDPLAGVAGLAREAESISRTDRGAIAGAVIGIVAAIGLSFTQLRHLVAAPPQYELLASALVLGVVGLACGAVLGTALGPQRSTHAGFRLVDAAEAGDVILLVSVPATAASGARATLEKAGARNATVFEMQP